MPQRLPAEMKNIKRNWPQREEAVSKGVFGAPWVIVDGEPFWGNDRLPQLEKWLATGGF